MTYNSIFIHAHGHENPKNMIFSAHSIFSLPVVKFRGCCNCTILLKINIAEQIKPGEILYQLQNIMDELEIRLLNLITYICLITSIATSEVEIDT